MKQLTPRDSLNSLTINLLTIYKISPPSWTYRISYPKPEELLCSYLISLGPYSLVFRIYYTWEFSLLLDYIFLIMDAESKVNNFHLLRILIYHHNILRFNVSMDDIFRVNVIYRKKQLMNEHFNVVFFPNRFFLLIKYELDNDFTFIWSIIMDRLEPSINSNMNA